MCYTSKRMRTEWTRLVKRVIVPALKRGLADLRRDHKERLFAGVLVGSEPTFDDYRHTDPATAKMISDDGGVKGRTGYRALMDRGYRKARPPARFEQALGSVIQETVAFWCRQFVEAGIPSNKLYPHVTAPAPAEMTGAPIGAAFNRWSRPGWTTYPNGVLESGLGPIYAELRKHGAGPWAGVEANSGFPGSYVDWESYLGWHFNHGSVIMAINTGASGTDLPARLEKSAYGAEALAAYRRFLGGKPLRERPVKVDRPELRVKRKVQAIQAEFRRWQAAGKDPSPIAMRIEQQMPGLSQSGKIEEIDALLDAALKELKAGPGR